MKAIASRFLSRLFAAVLRVIIGPEDESDVDRRVSPNGRYEHSHYHSCVQKNAEVVAESVDTPTGDSVTKGS